MVTIRVTAGDRNLRIAVFEKKRVVFVSVTSHTVYQSNSSFFVTYSKEAVENNHGSRFDAHAYQRVLLQEEALGKRGGP